MISTLTLLQLTWKAYFIFMATNACFIPLVYYCYPEVRLISSRYPSITDRPPRLQTSHSKKSTTFSSQAEEAVCQLYAIDRFPYKSACLAKRREREVSVTRRAILGACTEVAVRIILRPRIGRFRNEHVVATSTRSRVTCRTSFVLTTDQNDFLRRCFCGIVMC